MKPNEKTLIPINARVNGRVGLKIYHARDKEKDT
jgi:hypothetical protein